MGIAASTGPMYPKKIQVVPRLAGEPNISGRLMSDKLLLYSDELPGGNQSGALRSKDHYPEKIRLVKPPPNVPLSAPSYGSVPMSQQRYMDPPFSDPGSLREGEIVLVQEPGMRHPRRMRIVKAPTQPQVQYQQQQQIYSENPFAREPHNRIVYYDMPRSDPRSNYNGASNVDNQNMVYVYTPPKRSERVMSYNFPYQTIESQRFHSYDDHQRGRMDVPESQFITARGSNMDSGYRDLSNLTSASRLSSATQQPVVTSRQLEVETLEKFQDPDGKTYKIVKPVGERTKFTYKKPEDYDKFLIVESPKKELSRTVSPKPLTPEPPREPTPQPPKVPTPEPPKDPTPEPPRDPTPEPPRDPTPEPPKIPTPEPPKEPTPEKKVGATISTQTNPKVNYKKVNYRENKTLQLRKNHNNKVAAADG